MLQYASIVIVWDLENISSFKPKMDIYFLLELMSKKYTIIVSGYWKPTVIG